MSFMNKVSKTTMVFALLFASQLPMNLYATEGVANPIEKRIELESELSQAKELISGIEREKNEILSQLETFESAQEILDNKIKDIQDVLRAVKAEIAEEEAKKQKELLFKTLESNPLGRFRLTAYDLSIASCGRAMGHKSYGLTASGFPHANKSRTDAMSIAVDRSVIPLGSKVYMKFDAPYTHFNGIYTARDTGSAIKGKKIDVFMGDFRQNNTHPSVNAFGVRAAEVFLLPKDFELTNADLASR